MLLNIQAPSNTIISRNAEGCGRGIIVGENLKQIQQSDKFQGLDDEF
jgi:hypothetical protein